MKANCDYKTTDRIGQIMSEMGLELLTLFRVLGDALILDFLMYVCMDRAQL